MPSKFPSTQIWAQMADLIGCDVPTIKAVFEVEAAGKFYNADGSLPRRFEPHHFPKQYWGDLGFSPKKGEAAWRASLKVKTAARRRMFDIAAAIDAEATYDASSWGAPQIMGFNAEAAGFSSARTMVTAFEESADKQITAFVYFVIENDLDTHLRSQNWNAFASGYNGSGQAAVYGAKIESAYRRQSGGRASAPLLRLGSKGAAVQALQVQLNELGFDVVVDSDFGAGTKRAVTQFQSAHELVADGVAGAATIRELARLLEGETHPEIKAPRAEQAKTVTDLRLETAAKYGTSILGAGGVTGMLSNLNDNSQTILIGGLVVGALIVASLFLLKKRI
mgnify:FL=1